MHAACPLDFDFCKELAADGKFMEEFVRMAAREKKEETERLQKQGEKAKKQREQIDAANKLQAQKDGESLKELQARVEKMQEAVSKSKASVASGPDPLSASGFSARAPKTPPAQDKSLPPSMQRSKGERVPAEWEFVPASGLSKAKLFRWDIAAESGGWSDWNSMDH